MIICLKYRKISQPELKSKAFTSSNFTGQRKQHRKEANENLKKAEVQRDRYYATIHKVALHAGDKIPGWYLRQHYEVLNQKISNLHRIIGGHQSIRHLPTVGSQHFGAAPPLRTGQHTPPLFHVPRTRYD